MRSDPGSQFVGFAIAKQCIIGAVECYAALEEVDMCSDGALEWSLRFEESRYPRRCNSTKDR